MRSAARLAIQHYSTAELPARDRHEAWANRGWPSMAPAFRTTPLQPFDTASDWLRLGELVIHYTRMTGQRWERDAAMLRSHHPDALSVAITLAGEARGRMGETDFRTGAGSVQLCDLAQTSIHESAASRTILVSVPRPIAAARGLDVKALHGTVLRSGAAALLAPHLLGLRETAPELDLDDGALLGRTVLDLLCVAVASSGQAAAPSAAARTGASAIAARREIEALLGSPSLTAASLCRRLGVSRTTLHRLFEAEGGVQAYVRGRRLEAARRALADPANAEPIHALAERLGFSDAPHLSRLFRTRYGLAPSDYRAWARAARTG